MDKKSISILRKYYIPYFREARGDLRVIFEWLAVAAVISEVKKAGISMEEIPAHLCASHYLKRTWQTAVSPAPFAFSA